MVPQSGFTRAEITHVGDSSRCRSEHKGDVVLRETCQIVVTSLCDVDGVLSHVPFQSLCQGVRPPLGGGKPTCQQREEGDGSSRGTREGALFTPAQEILSVQQDNIPKCPQSLHRTHASGLSWASKMQPEHWAAQGRRTRYKGQQKHRINRYVFMDH